MAIKVNGTVVIDDSRNITTDIGTIDGRDVAADGTKLDGIAAGAQVNVATNLSNTANATSLTIESSTGSNTSLPAATNTTWGVMTDEDRVKLDGIEAGATADQTAAEIRTLVESATDSNVFTDADHTKLNGIEVNAKDDQTITAGAGLTGGGTGDITISHADTSSQANISNTGSNIFIQDITLDSFGHITAMAATSASVSAAASQDLFWENLQTVLADYTITNGHNAMSAGPITIADGVTVTVGDGEAWTIV